MKIVPLLKKEFITDLVEDELALKPRVQRFLRDIPVYEEAIMEIISNLVEHGEASIGDILLRNTFLPQYQSMFIAEVHDLLLPYYISQPLSFFCEGPYEQELTPLEEEDIVIDCGANIGIFSVVAGTKCKKGHVYAFEPATETKGVLQETILNYPNITAVPLGLSQEKGQITMSVYANNLGISSILPKDGEESANLKLETIELTTIDDFVREQNLKRVDFIKADIEGAERQMLQGAREVLKKFQPKLSICTYHLPDDPEVLEAIILEANPNYRIVHSCEKLYACVPDKK